MGTHLTITQRMVYPPSAFTSSQLLRFSLFSTKNKGNWKLFFLIRSKQCSARESVHTNFIQTFHLPSKCHLFPPRSARVVIYLTEVINISSFDQLSQLHPRQTFKHTKESKTFTVLHLNSLKKRPLKKAKSQKMNCTIFPRVLFK